MRSPLLTAIAAHCGEFGTYETECAPIDWAPVSPADAAQTRTTDNYARNADIVRRFADEDQAGAYEFARSLNSLAHIRNAICVRNRGAWLVVASLSGR